MAEIVVSEPVGGDESELGNGFGFTRCIEYGECSSQAVPPEPFDSERIPVDLGSEIRKFLRVANQIENEEPRVAYLCRFHAFVKAHLMDRNSTGRGVRQFKTSLLQRLERDMPDTIPKRTERSDIRELRRVYKGYEDYIVRYIGVTDYANREKLINARAIASALLEVLNAVSSAAGHRAIADREQIATESELYVPYNILPLDRGGTHLPIMQIPEIKAACAAVRNVRGLPLPEDLTRHSNSLDIFQWLQLCFGFQTGNVANQREHLILLLANTHIRQGQKHVSQLQLLDEAVDGLMRKLFRNYTDWCKFLAKKSNIRLPYVKQEAQQYKLLYIGLYLLIWGEAANLRFMPECLCFIYHHMAYELHSMLTSAISLTTSERVMPAYGGAPESFLNNVVCPIYKVIYEEAEKNKNGPAEHSSWRNYDDLNEFFWKHDCFQIGWPMRLGHDFFHVRSSDDCDARKPMFPLKNIREKRHINRDEELPEMKEEEIPNNWLGKTNFVEIRSFWQIFRSFDRMWCFLILALQALIIIGCHELSSPLELTETAVVEDVMSIFITSAILKLIHAILDIAFSWKARHTMNFHQILKYVLKLIVAVIWTAILPIYYAQGRTKYTCFSGSGLQEWCSSSYMVAVLVYIMTNAVDVVLFLVPAIGMHIETSNCTILTVLSWWTQPRLYVGRGMQEDLVSAFKYTMFWSILLLMKLSFSYYFEIKPLIAPTKQIMRIGFRKYEWHNFFQGDKSNACAVVAVWAPIVLVYFMDTQIWYSVLCAIFGGVYGILNHLGEIRTLRMLRSSFPSLPSAFNSCLIPPSSGDGGGMHLFRLPFKKDPRSKDKHSVRYDRDREWSYLFHHPFQKIARIKNNGFVKFAIVWNKIISSFREEDLLSNREMDLMLISPSPNCFPDRVCWPVFLLADKLSTAVSIARDFVGKDEDLFNRIMNDVHMNCAVKECYESLMCILDSLVVGDIEKRIISGILGDIEEYMDASALLKHIKLSELPTLQAKCTDLLVLLAEGNEHHHAKVVKVLQDIFELVATDMLITGSRTLESLYSSLPSKENGAYFLGDIQSELFASKDSLKFPLADNGPLLNQVKRFLLLLTVNDTALDIPVNLEARRRIAFFATSLFMNMPSAPKVCNMVSFSVLTPHYTEDVKYSLKELQSSQGQVPIIFYMQKIYPDEWENFLERMCIKNIDALKSENRESVLRDWTSFRGQTLSRTVRGMMYYRKALKLQAFLDMMDDEDILQGYDPNGRGNDALSAQLDALADLKFTYIISCQMYGAQKSLGDPHAQDILDLMDRYPSLRVAYVEEKELIVADKVQKVYSSVLVKAVNHFDQNTYDRREVLFVDSPGINDTSMVLGCTEGNHEIYRVKLPGQPNIGEGKPENQNHAIIFTRGEALQTIDMNQDNYFEEAFKVRNVLQEFLQHRGKRHPTILGMREHIFTGSISSLAWFMSYQETSLVTIGQRLLANPLRVRFHYGHPDFFDRVFHITRGGISKASKTINLSEDVFAGFNSVLRRGYITYHEYMQVGKGRDVGLNQISKFEAKVANGNSEQSISRDVYRLGHQFDFFRMLSLYFTTIGFYFSSLVSVIAVYVFLYGQLFLILSGLQKTLQIEARVHSIKSLETALASQSYIQLGLLTGLPMVMEIGLEKGLLTAIQDIVLMQLQLASVFFTFSFGTKAHYYGRTILHGGAKYRPTGRKVVISHASFTENYRLYSRSHFVKGFELMLLLTVYEIFRRYQGAMAYTFVSYAIWFMSFTWLFAPFLFNPSCFNWQTVVDDWMDWNRWIRHQGGIGIQQDKSWQSWWDDEQQHLRRASLLSRIIEILLSLRFFLYQYGLVYHLNISQQSKNVVVYVLSWVVMVIIFLLVKTVDLGRQWLSANHQLAFRLFKAILFLAMLSTMIFLSIVCDLSFMDLVMCCLAFLPTGWGLILFAQVIRPKIEDTGLWDFMQVLARAYDYGMGIILFFPIAFLAWLPIISAFQSRFLFNQAFNRKLQIRAILAGKKQT